MITALLIGLIKTIVIAFWNLISSIFGFVFSNVSSFLSFLATVPGLNVGIYIIDQMIGWDWLIQNVGSFLVILSTVKLAKLIVGFFTKGVD
ncbi:MAG: hypothetical protein ACP5HC_09545 [Caldisericum sp.]|jgi:hypothetical protein